MACKEDCRYISGLSVTLAKHDAVFAQQPPDLVEERGTLRYYPASDPVNTFPRDSFLRSTTLPCSHHALETRSLRYLTQSS